MGIQKSEAIVLKTQPFRSTSLIVTFYTRAFGKIKGIAKGVRQEREVRGALFELFNHVEIIFYERQRSDLHLVTEVSLLESYDALHRSLEGIAYASYFSELTDQLTEIQDPHEAIFHLLRFSFQYLTSIPPERIEALFEIKLFREIGWLPHLESCLGCGASHLEKGYFSARQGGLLCARCARRDGHARPVTRETLAALRYDATHDPESCLKLGLSRSTEGDLAELLTGFLDDRLGRTLRTRQFLREIKTVLT